MRLSISNSAADFSAFCSGEEHKMQLTAKVGSEAHPTPPHAHAHSFRTAAPTVTLTDAYVLGLGKSLCEWLPCGGRCFPSASSLK